MSNISHPTNAGGLSAGSEYNFNKVPVPVQAASPDYRSALAVAWPAHPAAGGPVIRRVPAVVGEPLDFFCSISAVRTTWTLARTPAKPKGWGKNEVTAQLTANRLTCKTPGLFVVDLDLDGFGKRVEVVCVSPEMLVALQASDGVAARCRLRSVVRDERISADSVVDALESHDFEGGVTFARLLGTPRAPFNAKDYGC